jgi:hypothetical protein
MAALKIETNEFHGEDQLTAELRELTDAEGRSVPRRRPKPTFEHQA